MTNSKLNNLLSDIQRMLTTKLNNLLILLNDYRYLTVLLGVGTINFIVTKNYGYLAPSSLTPARSLAPLVSVGNEGELKFHKIMLELQIRKWKKYKKRR